jgi:cell division protein ZapA
MAKMDQVERAMSDRAMSERAMSERAMSQVTVTINGRQFRMACEIGQEAHLLRLAEDLDRRIERLRTTFGEIGDTRLTVMAALTISDELNEANGKLHRIEEELATLQNARATSAERASATQAAVAAALNSAAERIEQVTKALNHTGGRPVTLG